jgi:hypothetical protein
VSRAESGWPSEKAGEAASATKTRVPLFEKVRTPAET